MKLEKGEYEILTFDHEGYTLTSTITDTYKQAKTRAEQYLTDPEFNHAHKIEIRNHKQEILQDYFYPEP